MLELRAGGGFGGAAKQFLDRYHLLVVSAVLSVAGIATGITSVMAALQSFVLRDILVLAISVGLAAAVSLVQTRNLPLAVVTALAPVPGLLWAAPVSGGADFAAIPVLAYGLGYAVAALYAHGIVENALGHAAAEPPWRAAAGALLLMALVTLIWFHRTPSADAALQAVADSALCGFSAVVLLPLAAAWFRFDENFIAQANRERERRGRLFQWVALVTVPRWAFSFTGIAIVFLALGWYGAVPVLRDAAWSRAATVLLVTVSAGVFTGGWRQGLSAGLITSVVCLLTLWATAIDPRVLHGPIVVLQVCTLGLFLGLVGGRRALARRRQHEPPVIAERRTVEQASGQAFAGLGTTIVLFPTIFAGPESWVFVIVAVVAASAAVVFLPAAATALEVLIPRRRSVEDLYGRRNNVAP